MQLAQQATDVNNRSKQANFKATGQLANYKWPKLFLSVCKF